MVKWMMKCGWTMNMVKWVLKYGCSWSNHSVDFFIYIFEGMEQFPHCIYFPLNIEQLEQYSMNIWKTKSNNYFSLMN